MQSDTMQTRAAARWIVRKPLPRLATVAEERFDALVAIALEEADHGHGRRDVRVRAVDGCLALQDARGDILLVAPVPAAQPATANGNAKGRNARRLLPQRTPPCIVISLATLL